MPTLNVQDTARDLLRKHGDQAAIHAAMEADACMGRGDMEQAYSWRRVVNAIHTMTASQSERVQ